MSKPDKFVRPSRITVPEHAHPLSKLVFSLMRDHGVTYEELSYYSGVDRSCIKSYRCEKIGSLRSYEALLAAFGWGLTPTPPLSSLSQEVRDAVDDISLHFRSDAEVIAAALAAMVRPCEEIAPISQKYGAPIWRIEEAA